MLAVLLCSMTVMVSPTCAWTTSGSCHATVVVAAADGLALAATLAAALEESLLLDEPHALTPSASSSAAPITPAAPIFFLTSHLRWLGPCSADAAPSIGGVRVCPARTNRF